jgi:hypothetical protein
LAAAVAAQQLAWWSQVAAAVVALGFFGWVVQGCSSNKSDGQQLSAWLFEGVGVAVAMFGCHVCWQLSLAHQSD